MGLSKLPKWISKAKQRKAYSVEPIPNIDQIIADATALMTYDKSVAPRKDEIIAALLTVNAYPLKTTFNLKVPEAYSNMSAKTKIKSIEMQTQELLERGEPSAVDTMAALTKLGKTKCDTYLDIGSGVGVTSAIIANRMQAKHVYLLDGDGSAPPFGGGYQETTVAWHNVSIAAAMVRANAEAQVYELQSNRARYIVNRQFDLVTSFRAWGHHFAVDPYVPLVYDNLAPDGFVVVDLRHDTANLGKLKSAGFEVVAVIDNHSSKCQRTVLRRK